MWQTVYGLGTVFASRTADLITLILKRALELGVHHSHEGAALVCLVEAQLLLPHPLLRAQDVGVNQLLDYVNEVDVVQDQGLKR